MTSMLRRLRWLAASRWAPLLLGGLGFLVFAGTLRHGFVYDDARQVVENPWIWSARFLPDLLLRPVWAFLDPSAANFYRPVQTLFHFVAGQLFGRRPFGFHLISVLVHALASGAALLLLRRGTSPLRALFASALFAVHPIHAEVVAWVSAGPDANAALFIFLALALWAGCRAGERPPLQGAALAGLSFLLALLSKETAIITPLLALCLPSSGGAQEVFSGGRGAARWRGGAAWGLAFGAPLVVYLTARGVALGGLLPATPRAGLGNAQALGSALMLLPRYLGLAFLPWNVVPDRVVAPAAGPFDPAALSGLALLAAAAAAWFRSRRRTPVVAFGIALLLVPLAPALQVKYFASSLQADRYLYIPSLGACLLLAEGTAALFRRRRGDLARAALVVTAAALLLVGAVRAKGAAAIWRDSETLGRGGIALEPRSIVMRLELVHALDASGRADEALHEADCKLEEMEYMFLEADGNISIQKKR